jgi:predicted 3-demethylubiquinone-9 3-methyltransferase (glyoxalase superfamily)
MTSITPFLMFNDQLDAALDFYTSTFPDAEIVQVSRTGGDGPIQAGEFGLAGQRFKAFNGGTGFTFSEGVSLHVDCANQAEVDMYWNRFVDAGGTPCSAAGSAIRSGCRGRSCPSASSN